LLVLHHHISFDIMAGFSDGQGCLAHAASDIYAQYRSSRRLEPAKSFFEWKKMVWQRCLGGSSFHRFIHVLETNRILQYELEYGKTLGVMGVCIWVV